MSGGMAVGGAGSARMAVGTGDDNVRTSELGTVPQRQSGNGCGTCSTAMALTTVLGRQVNQSQVDQHVRRMDIFTSPDNIGRAAEEFGIDSRMVNNLTPDEIMSNIDAGRPICFLSDMTPENTGDVATLHWRVIDGYRQEGDDMQYRVVDPHGMANWISASDLEAQWGNIEAGHMGTGFNHFGVIMGSGPDDKLGPNRMGGARVTAFLADVVADGANTLQSIGENTKTLVDLVRSIDLPRPDFSGFNPFGRK